jgi:hypothetical protein
MTDDRLGAVMMMKVHRQLAESLSDNELVTRFEQHVPSEKNTTGMATNLTQTDVIVIVLELGSFVNVENAEHVTDCFGMHCTIGLDYLTALAY